MVSVFFQKSERLKTLVTNGGRLVFQQSEILKNRHWLKTCRAFRFPDGEILERMDTGSTKKASVLSFNKANFWREWTLLQKQMASGVSDIKVRIRRKRLSTRWEFEENGHWYKTMASVLSVNKVGNWASVLTQQGESLKKMDTGKNSKRLVLQKVSVWRK